MILRPGKGWKHLKGAVWEHADGARIHISGKMFRTSREGSIIPTRKVSKMFDHLLKVNGGNEKRALMALSLTMGWDM